MPRSHLTPFRSVVLTSVAISLWRGLAHAYPSVATVELAGWIVAYLLGLAWVVYLVERAAWRIEAKRVVVQGQARPLISVGGEVPDSHTRGWNPFDPAARFYGRSDQRLRQSLAILAAYSLLFVLVYFLAHLKFDDSDSDEIESELPAGGGKDSIKPSSVKVQKVVRKKYPLNPYSRITFTAPPPLDKIDVNLTADTANLYKAGQGGGGLGRGTGKGGGFGSGTGAGKYQLVRLRHAAPHWDKNFAIGGDRNLLAELKLRSPESKVSEDDVSFDYAQIARISAKKPTPLIYVCGSQFAPSASDKKILHEYLIDKHGMILGDNLTGGGFHNNFVTAMTEITGVSPVPIPRDDPIHRRPYELPQLPIVVAHGGTTALGWKIDGRWVVYYHPGALSDAWRDDRAGIKKEIAELCYQLGINVLYYAYSEQDKWRQSQQP